MRLSVVFPSVLYRDGPGGVIGLMRAIEHIGFDELAMFDHVLMGHETDTRPAPYYPSKMPILEALMTLSFAASATERIGLGTGVLVLPQRQVALVAKQVSTLDTLSGGRVRLGVGVGWQRSEYEALGEDFSTRGRRVDEAIELLRRYWTDDPVDFAGDHHSAEAMAMEPKPPQGGGIPIWIGGAVPQTLERVGRHGDGWMGQFVRDEATARRLIARIGEHAEAAGRDPATIGTQLGLRPPKGMAAKEFYSHATHMAEAAASYAEIGFDWASIDGVGLFQAGFRSADAMADHLADIHAAIRAAVGSSPSTAAGS